MTASYTLNDLLGQAVQKNASDLHLAPDQPALFRIEGLLEPDGEHLEASHLREMLLNHMTSVQQEKCLSTLECDFTYELKDLARFRAHIYHQQNGMAAAFRVIPKHIPTLSELKLPPIFETLSQESHGLILITGPTGSGKSTSLAAWIDGVNQTQAKHIITLEDPIEFVHTSQKSLITQREIPRDALSFQQALRAALREDPDIICIAELRDLETIRLALTAAETGHLVLGTLHTPSAPKTLDRLIDVFPGNEKEMVRTMLSESLLSVIAQKGERDLEGRRKMLFEVLVATPAIRHLIRENKTAQIYSAMQTGQAVGMCTFEQYAMLSSP